MTEVFKAIILGIVQGLTEFLPVSSSGHLEILNELLGSNQTIDDDLMMVVLVHFGTALSILYIFRRDVYSILRDIFTFKQTADAELGYQILVSMLPALVIGLAFEEYIDRIFSGSVFWVGIFLICTGLILFFTPTKLGKHKVNYPRALVIGVAQAVAILPGISRSGSTIAAALTLDIDKERAARFSFLMVVPIIIGKIILDIISGDFALTTTNWSVILAALLSSFVVGVVACRWMLSIVRSSKLKYFAYYCFAIGTLTICWHLYG